ncbi:FkbM family methyltransferase [Bradyrhizobium sp. HKCCYLRH3099]|uniref:FkbM family methyltransferase n=1 Tax=unclassified Bradyrhizobium TaxID=2631580 RepID=UPI003EBB9030
MAVGIRPSKRPYGHAKRGVAFEGSSMRRGSEWARRIARSEQSESVEVVTLLEILGHSGHDRISLLKVDIEGSEIELFGSGSEDWIDRVDNLVIELHGDVAKDVFYSAIEGRGYFITHCDELTVCRSPR